VGESTFIRTPSTRLNFLREFHRKTSHLRPAALILRVPFFFFVSDNTNSRDKKRIKTSTVTT